MAYSFTQTLFMRNMAANGIGDYYGTDVELQDWLNVYLNGGTDPNGQPFLGYFNWANNVRIEKPANPTALAGGDWEVVWGPCVLSPTLLPHRAPGAPAAPNAPTDKTLKPACNSMYVAKSDNLNAYVVAIAATNPISFHDWLIEDVDVDPHLAPSWPIKFPFVPVPNAAPKEYAVSAATASGLSKLHAMKDGDKDIKTFLKDAASSAYTLYFTGHSLAGALSPTLAFDLYPDSSSKSGWAGVFTMPTADATPGTVDFINGKQQIWPLKDLTGFSQAYPPTTTANNDNFCPQWNCDILNANDVVPHAWNLLPMVIKPVPPKAVGFYTSFWGYVSEKVGAELTSAVDTAITGTGNGEYYTNIPHFPANGFTPTWGEYVWTYELDGSYGYPPKWTDKDPYDVENPMNSLGELGAMIMATHISQYCHYFGVEPAPRLPRLSTLHQKPAVSLAATA